METTVRSNDIQLQLDIKNRRLDILKSVLPFTGLLLVTVFLIFATGGKLVSRANLNNLLTQSFTISLVGVGAAFVYAHGGMDFSIGASCGLGQFVAVLLIFNMDMPISVGIIASIIIGISASSLVGGISLLMRVPPFITSLGVRAICAGLLELGTNGVQINTDYSRLVMFNSVPFRFTVLLLVFIIGFYLFEKTTLGKYQKAIGGNINNASQSGIRVNIKIMISYIILGICVGLAAFFQLARTGVVSSNSGSGLEFQILLAIVLGGFPMSGGSMSKIRAVIIGAFTITILSNGLVLWGLNVDIVNGVMGLLFLIIVALSYDRTVLKQVKLN